MGHGDELVIGDSNFPAQSMGQRCVRCDGHKADELLDAILQLFPLDQFVEAPVTVMAPAPGMLDGDPPIWGRGSTKSWKSISRERKREATTASPL